MNEPETKTKTVTRNETKRYHTNEEQKKTHETPLLIIFKILIFSTVFLFPFSLYLVPAPTSSSILLLLLLAFLVFLNYISRK